MCAVDRDALVRVLEKCWSNREGVAASGREHCAAFADALLSSGVLVDDSDVRARAHKDAWDQGARAAFDIANADLRMRLRAVNPYSKRAAEIRDRAVSEREGTT